MGDRGMVSQCVVEVPAVGSKWRNFQVSCGERGDKGMNRSGNYGMRR